MVERPKIIQLELDLQIPGLQLIDDMGLMEGRDIRSKRAGRRKETQLYDETRAIAERDDIANHAKLDLAMGVLENYEKLAPIGEDDGNEHSTITHAAHPRGRRSS